MQISYIHHHAGGGDVKLYKSKCCIIPPKSAKYKLWPIKIYPIIDL